MRIADYKVCGPQSRRQDVGEEDATRRLPVPSLVSASTR
jgi:hypothetical protein